MVRTFKYSIVGGVSGGLLSASHLLKRGFSDLRAGTSATTYWCRCGDPARPQMGWNCLGIQTGDCWKAFNDKQAAN